MDGDTALQYARSRHGTSDFARAGRQQKVIVSVRNRALQLNMLSQAPELVGIIQKSLSTDLTPVQMLSLAKLVSQIDRDKISNLVIDANYVTPFKGADGADLLRPEHRRRSERAITSAAEVGGASRAAGQDRGAQRQRHGRAGPEGGRLSHRAGLQRGAHRGRRAQRLPLVAGAGAERDNDGAARRWPTC